MDLGQRQTKGRHSAPFLVITEQLYNYTLVLFHGHKIILHAKESLFLCHTVAPLVVVIIILYYTCFLGSRAPRLRAITVRGGADAQFIYLIDFCQRIL